MLLIGIAYILHHRHDKAQLKSSLFNVILAVMLAMRSLGSFSGMLHAEDFQDTIAMVIPSNACSGFKGMLLHIVFSLETWGRTWLGKFDESPEQSTWADEPRRPLEADRKELNIPWRDALLRVAYYHLLDGFLHVAWLRFGCGWGYDEGRPFTQYMNNEEVVVVVFWVLMMGWTYLRYRWRRETALEQDLEKGFVDELEVEVEV